MMRRLSLLGFLLVCALSVAQLLHAAWVLPEQVPLHFSFDGTPDSHGSRAALIILNWVLLAFNAALFLALPWLMARLPDDLINLPNKDYWLAPARRQSTLESLASHMRWMGCATQLLMMDLLAQTVKVATGSASALGHSNWSLGIYLLFTALWVGLLYGRFRRPA
jgi:hypothetical protein